MAIRGETVIPPVFSQRGDVKIPSINFSQKVTEPSKGISYPVGDLRRRFIKVTGPCAYTLHSNPIPPTDGTNGFFDTCIHFANRSPIFPNMFLSSYCGEF